MPKAMKTAVVLSVLALFAVSVYTYYDACHAEEPVYRPMCFYDNTLFYDEGITAETGKLEYMGKINSCAGSHKRPKKNFECNYEAWLGAELYKDENNAFYIKLLNGRFLKLKASGSGAEITAVVPFN